MTPERIAAVTDGTGCDAEARPRGSYHRALCKTPENKLALLDNLSAEDVRGDRVTHWLASQLPHHPALAARAAHAWVRDNVRFVPEAIETFKSPGRTLREGGDCDDSARVLVSMARAAGLKARYRPITQCKAGVCEKTHVAAQIHDGRGWHWAETTIDAEFGEHPLVAYRRLRRAGRIGKRGDIGGLGAVASEAGDAVLLGIPGIEKTSQAFRRELVAVARRLGIEPDHLSAVISIESGYNPAAVNPNGGASGLIQFRPATARNLGTTVEAIRKMGDAEQLPLVERYFAPFRGKLKLAEDVYVAVFTPAHVGKGSAHVISSAGEKIYESNRVLDLNKDGQITNGDLGAWVEVKLAQGRSRPPVPVENVPARPSWPWWLFGSLTAAGVGYALWETLK